MFVRYNNWSARVRAFDINIIPYIALQVLLCQRTPTGLWLSTFRKVVQGVISMFHCVVRMGWLFYLFYEIQERAYAQRTGAAARVSLRRDRPADSRRLHSTLAAAPVLFAHAVVTEIKNK